MPGWRAPQRVEAYPEWTERRAPHQEREVKKPINIDTAAASQLVGINYACSHLDVSRSTFYRLVKGSKLRLIKVGCGSKVTVGGLRQLIAAAA